MSESYRLAFMVKRGEMKLADVPPGQRTRVARLSKDLSERQIVESIASSAGKAGYGAGHPGQIRRVHSS